MRAQTLSYIVSVKLYLPKQIENRLEKSFRISNSAYNEGISLGLKRFEAMKRDPHYQELLEARRLAKAGINKLKKAKKKTKGLVQQVKLYDKVLFELRKAYGLTEFCLSVYLNQQRRNDGSPYQQLSASEIQVVAHQAMKTLEKVLFYQIKPHKVRFRSKFDLNVSYRNNTNKQATRLVPSNKKGIAYRLYIHRMSIFVDIPIKAFNTYQQMSLLRCEKIKYVQIVRKTIRGKKVYILQIICQGKPLSKVTKGNGVIKKGARFKRPSKRQLRLRNRRRKTYRSLSEERTKLQGQLINRIVSQASSIKMEELNVKGLQKRSRDIRINPKTNRPFSKKRFGKAIFRAAPSAFRTALEKRASQLGVNFEIISPKNVKPSQYNHITQTFEKKSLSIRVYDLSNEYKDVQRDLYSAFLIGHIENDHYQQEQLEQDFPDFYNQMKNFLQQPIKTKRLVWYLK